MHHNNYGWLPVDLADLVGLVPIPAAAYGVVLGGALLITGWQLFSNTTPNRRRRGSRGVYVAVSGVEVVASSLTVEESGHC